MRRPQLLGQRTGQERAAQNPRQPISTCVRKLPVARKEPFRKIRGDSAHTGLGTVPVPRSQPGKTSRSREHRQGKTEASCLRNRASLALDWA